MGLDGTVSSQGSISDALLKDGLFAKEVAEEEQALRRAEREAENGMQINPPQNDGKLIVAEEVEEGHVSWSTCE